MPRRRSGTSLSPSSRSPKRLRRNEVIPESRTARNAGLGNDISGRIRVVSDREFIESSAALKEIDDEEATELRPRTLQLYPKENTHAHKTEDYESENVVLRRGQDFDLAITFDRPLDKTTDSLILQFTTGSRPKESKGSIVRIPVLEKNDALKDDWQASYTSFDDKTVEIRAISPPDAIIGKYKIFIETLTSKDDSKFQNRKGFEESFILICNPFCSGDMVYMEDVEHRQEYVMKDTGRIWQGSPKDAGTPWYFGQFEAVTLEAALYLLDKAELAEGAKSNCVQIVRAISQMSNSNDDCGVLEGLWADEYPGGTLPWAWIGSVAILTEYMKTKKAVKYGQCWVFSGIVTSLCRALGIPARSITNFDSAHDHDGSATIDYHWNEEDEPLDDLNDSVWNFHVWNECWFKRTDIPDGFDGWQAFDATPQEASDGVMKCGPAPVKAIKEGMVYFPYDCKFIFSEVNGDKIHWLVKKDGSYEVLRVVNGRVGRHISTKAVGTDLRDDVTSLYKYPEGSTEERTAVHKAFTFSSRKEYKVYDSKAPDVKFDLISPEQITIGDDFELKVHLKNLTEEERNVHVRLSAVACFYTGVPSENVGVQVFDEKLEANEEKTISLPIKSETYIHILKPDSTMTVYLKGTVKETGRSYPDIEKIDVVKPSLMISVPEKVKVKEEFEVVIHLTNPLNEKLTGGCFFVESSRGIILPFKIPHKKAIPPGEEISVKLSASAGRSGNRDIIVSFSADQLSGMNGTASVYVSYAE